MHSLPINAERLKKMQDLGLTEYQARVYLTLLDLGHATASQIPSISRVPRTRVYATMNQLHEKGLVEIVPETPLKYRPVAISKYLQQRAEEMKDEARLLESRKDELEMEFAIKAEVELEQRGRFEAIYGRRNVRERLMKMYDSAKDEIIGVGTLLSPSRIVKSAIYTLEEKFKQGLTIRYAFPVNPQNREDVDKISRFAKIRAIGVQLPMYFYVFDHKEVLLNHPIPDDDNFYRGDDIAIWTNDEGIAKAMRTIADKIWNSGTEPGALNFTEPLLDAARQYLQLLGIRARPVFEALGREIGREIARSMKSREADELIAEIAEYWREHSLGKVEVVSRNPLEIHIENFVDCGKMTDAGQALCAFVENIVGAILDERLGVRSTVKENMCYGTKSNKCKLAITLDRKGVD